MKVLIILSIVYLQCQAATITYHAEWKNSQGDTGAYVIQDNENNPFAVKTVDLQVAQQLPEESLPSTEKVEEPPKEKSASLKKIDESTADKPPQETLDDDVAITGPVSQFISQAAPSSSNSHLLASNTVNSHVPSSGGSLSGIKIPATGLNIPTSGLNIPATGLNVPATGITIPLSSLLGSNIPLVAQTGSLTGSLLPVGQVTGGALSGALLQHVHGLLHHILGGRQPIIRPVHLSPGNLLVPGYSITVGGGGITLPGITRH